MNFPPPTEKQARLIWLALTGLAIAALVALIGGLLWGLGKIIQALSPVLWPVAVAAVMAVLLDPLVSFFQAKGLSRVRAILTVFGIALLISAGVFGILVPKLAGQTRQFVERVPEIVTGLEDGLNRLATNAPPWFKRLIGVPAADRTAAGPRPGTNAPPANSTTTNAVGPGPGAGASASAGTNAPSILERALDDKTLQSAKNWLAEALPGIGGWVFGQIGTWLGIIISLVLVPIYAFYILTEKYEIETNWPQYLPVADSRFKTELVFVLRALKNYMVAFFRGQVLVGMCEGVLYTIGFLLIDLPYGLVLGASAAVLTIIPFLGATILCIVSFIVAVVQCGDLWHPLGVLFVVFVVQSLEVFWISPRIMRGRVGLHPAIIIFAVMAGTTLLGGLLGGILAIPLAAMIKVMLSRYVWRRREA